MIDLCKRYAQCGLTQTGALQFDRSNTSDENNVEDEHRFPARELLCEIIDRQTIVQQRIQQMNKPLCPLMGFMFVCS